MFTLVVKDILYFIRIQALETVLLKKNKLVVANIFWMGAGFRINTVSTLLSQVTTSQESKLYQINTNNCSLTGSGISLEAAWPSGR